ncbi:Major apurinic/apyrimidinic endonuclease [Komagataella phaffii CBS 7435]|uniref:Apurinic-apyrimidinic endonuclease 1 n=2 Tax=Komagataella phaffii TaxID=460519 RepID=C4R5M7_KOMPG|nr:Major apurinic/apyrimidinic endonuclease, 3'-repair diesterase involved in repair of DNA damage [Komagataella phaffii GS115]AOA63217.1 GQ67_03915T0 [Komagataella phaffii]CAH2449333.1 Major apurinic/apyrimidinic endonuclease [Komagataella phaffii CBS 7435]AOA69148.1 GQ68_03889T0 [Komagataella phaffii GS115]CAY70863.1 Major apurinic/apyrimidinic endonuclease, 3'-repair diesterase involved in repair of DNA damage [Komagataella phaffii GS115]SCV12192.1 Major apurinic/apyrimidinic endonuclease [
MSKFKFGAHISTSGGVSNAVTNSTNISAKSFALFLKSPRRWVSPMFTDDEVNKFKALCKEHNYNSRTEILPHGSYFINLANPDLEKEEKAYGAFLDDLKRCELLDIGLYNFHPGSDLGSDHQEALKRLAKNINTAINETKFVKIVIENMAGHGNLIGSDLEDIKTVIDMVDDKSRVGVCIDTCHTFAAGYDIRDEESYNAFWELYDKTIGFEYLSAIHLNDSKAPLGANKDLHQKIGWGFLGLEPFRLIANSEFLQGIPLVLETPNDNTPQLWEEEIKLLEWLEGKSKDDPAVLERAAELSKLGKTERDQHSAKYAKKVEKGKKKTTKKGSIKDQPTVIDQLNKRKK